MALPSWYDPLAKGAGEANTSLRQPCIPTHGRVSSRTGSQAEPLETNASPEVRLPDNCNDSSRLSRPASLSPVPRIQTQESDQKVKVSGNEKFQRTGVVKKIHMSDRHPTEYQLFNQPV